MKIVVKWSGKEYEIDNLSQSDTVATLKEVIRKRTGVLPERQKLLNLKYKGENGPKFSFHYNLMYILFTCHCCLIAELSSLPRRFIDDYYYFPSLLSAISN